jgi:hypothetical protein
MDSTCVVGAVVGAVVGRVVGVLVVGCTEGTVEGSEVGAEGAVVGGEDGGLLPNGLDVGVFVGVPVGVRVGGALVGDRVGLADVASVEAVGAIEGTAVGTGVVALVPWGARQLYPTIPQVYAPSIQVFEQQSPLSYPQAAVLYGPLSQYPSPRYFGTSTLHDGKAAVGITVGWPAKEAGIL